MAQETRNAPSKNRIVRAIVSRKKLIFGLIGLMVFFIIWQIIAIYIHNSAFLATFSATLVALYNLAICTPGEHYCLAPNLYVSGVEYIGGFAAGVAAGLAIGLAMGASKIVHAFTETTLNALYATPTIALIPLIVIWFGIGLEEKFFFVFIAAIFPVMINTTVGVEGVDQSLLKMSKSFGLSTLQTWRHVTLPSAMPTILAGIRIASGRAIVFVTVAELYAANQGLGFLITYYTSSVEIANMLAIVLTVSVIGIASNEIVRSVEGRVLAGRGVKI